MKGGIFWLLQAVLAISPLGRFYMGDLSDKIDLENFEETGGPIRVLVVHLFELETWNINEMANSLSMEKNEDGTPTFNVTVLAVKPNLPGGLNISNTLNVIELPVKNLAFQMQVPDFYTFTGIQMYNYYMHMILERVFKNDLAMYEMLKEMNFHVTVTASAMGEIIGRNLGARTLWYMGNYPGPILTSVAK
jgi:hypothetical protein